MKKLTVKRNYILIAFVVVALVTAGSVFAFHKKTKTPSEKLSTTQVFLGDKHYKLLVADTIPKRIQGLSGKTTPLPLGAEGMVFMFGYESNHGIWMKDMLMPIDIYWLDREWKVVHRELNVSPDTYPTVFAPPTNATFVVELPASSSTIPIATSTVPIK